MLRGTPPCTLYSLGAHVSVSLGHVWRSGNARLCSMSRLNVITHCQIVPWRSLHDGFWLSPFNESDKIDTSRNVKICSPSVFPLCFCFYPSLRRKASSEKWWIGVASRGLSTLGSHPRFWSYFCTFLSELTDTPVFWRLSTQWALPTLAPQWTRTSSCSNTHWPRSVHSTCNRDKRRIDRMYSNKCWWGSQWTQWPRKTPTNAVLVKLLFANAFS